MNFERYQTFVHELLANTVQMRILLEDAEDKAALVTDMWTSNNTDGLIDDPNLDPVIKKQLQDHKKLVAAFNQFLATTTGGETIRALLAKRHYPDLF